jgi:nitroreductase
MAVIHDVLDLARWAPSGDNTQPWRFEILSETSALVHGYDTRGHCVYDLDGHASQLAHGALLETIAIAATRFGMHAVDAIVDEQPDGRTVYRIDLAPASADVREDPLAASIVTRSVERRAMKTTPLTEQAQRALREAVADYALRFETTIAARARIAILNASNAYIRLTIPEAFAVHQSVIAWDATTSEDRLPDASLGAGKMLLRTMRFAMTSFERVDRLNRFAGGTIMPRLALDLLPGIRCAAHFALIAPCEPRSLAERLRAGRAVQRLWLTATHLGLQLQPSYTPLVFARYARERRAFTRRARAQARALAIADRLEAIFGADRLASVVFLGRIGVARGPAKGRSLRRPLEQLTVKTPPESLG